MIAEIKKNLTCPPELEKMYRHNKADFKKAFNDIYPTIKDHVSAQVWHERLNFEKQEITWGNKNELIITIALAIAAGLCANLPLIAGLDTASFYQRNISFLFLPMLILYFSWKSQIESKHIVTISILMLLSIIYINVLPAKEHSDTLVLACIHLPLFIWGILGISFIGKDYMQPAKRIEFLKYNGDLVVITTVLLIAGGLLTAISVGLFELINIRFENYIQYIAPAGAASMPIVGSYLISKNPYLVKSVSPVISKVFTPMVLIMLLIYLAAIVYTGKDPYNDRQFLLIFNILLIGVMALILFSITEASKNISNLSTIWLLFSLSLVTILLNGIAFTAILFRISEWGITANRLAVLGGNILMLTNLIAIAFRLFRSLKDQQYLVSVNQSIGSFLPIYWFWTIIVVFLFPMIFAFN